MTQPQKQRNALHDLGYKIFLDRYALKDMTRATLAVGDTVIVVVNSATGQREVGKVTALNLPQVTIELNDGEVVTRDIEHVDKPIETDPAQMMDRVAAGIAGIEIDAALQAEWTEKFRWLLDDWKFVPGGRILTAAGTDQELSYYNCMPPDQEVLTIDGYKPIADVRVGDLVVTHKNRLRSVLHKFERETDEQIYVMKPRKVGYDALRVTGAHKIFVIRSEWLNTHRSRDGLRLRHQPEWIPAKDVRKGDYVAIAHDGEVCPVETIYIPDYVPDYNTENGLMFKPMIMGNRGFTDHGTHYSIKSTLTVDKDLCYLFGRWLGDGCITHRTGTDIPSGIKIVFALDELEQAEDIARIVEEKFGLAAAIKLSSTQRWYDLWVNSLPVGQFFKALLGCYSHSKRIPTNLMHLPNDLTFELLRGLFTSDGYISDNYVGILLANRTLTIQIHQLLLRLGYFFSIFENTHRNGKTPSYRVSAVVSEAGDVYEQFFGVVPPKRQFSSGIHLDYDNLKWVRIDSIETEDYSGIVMDIEVEEDHSFVSAGVVVSNCYVLKLPHDSRGGILETLRQMTEIMSRGGGVGITLSSLRPRHAYVKGVNGRSSGAVSWGALYSFVTGLIEQGGCFSANTRILTDKGLIPAAELADRMDAGETFSAHTHRGLRPITTRFRNGVKPLYEVETARGYRVQITEDHKVAVLMDGKITTMPLKYLQEGDEILLLLGQGVEGNYVPLKPLNYERSIMSTRLNTDVQLPSELNEDLAYFLGYAYADGYVQVGKKVTWQAPKALKLATADSHPKIRERLLNLVQTLFGIQPTVESGDGACQSIVVYSRMVIEWLIENQLLKPKAADVRVPEAIFRSPSSVMGAFIAGYFDADGCNRGKKGGFGIDSISRDMLGDLQQLLSMNGIVSHIVRQERSGNWQDIYRLCVTGNSFKERFMQFVNAEKVIDAVPGKRDMYHTYPATVWTQLGARSKYRQRIYDGVSERISYNQLTKIQTRLIEDEQVDFAEKMQDVLNVLPDTIATIRPLDAAEVFDFEVDDVHLLSGAGIYTSNSRRGALMLLLADWHPDVFDFITSKRKAGQITNANISVAISDEFMKVLREDGDWQLKFPDTSDPDYDNLWDGDIQAWEAAGRKVIVYRTIKARELWHAIIESAWASAEPGLLFLDRYNKMANSWYFAPLVGVNPCVTGDTRIYTNQGMVKAVDLFNDETDIEAVIDGRFGLEHATTPSTRVFMTGTKPVYRLQTKEGYFLRATSDHRIMTPRGWVELQDLNPGDKIHILNRKGGFGQEGSLELGRVLGWLTGDGHFNASQGAILSFFGDEKETLAPIFAEYVNQLVEAETIPNRAYTISPVAIAGRDETRISSTRLMRIAEQYGVVANKLCVPEVVFQGAEEMQQGYLQALFTADGSFQDGGEKGGSIRLASSYIPLLEGVQMLLSNFGISSRIYRNRRHAQYRDMPDGKGGLKSYWCEAQHDLTITKGNMTVFSAAIGFILPRKQHALSEYLSRGKRGVYRENFIATVESITQDGIEDVFDITEPITHSMITNGVVVHQCGEQSLPGNGVCNLGAINLAKFYDEIAGDVAWDDLDRAVEYAVRFLDNVVDANPYFREENKKQQLGERRVGLGTMGIAELMIYCQVRYGSPESEAFIDKLYSRIARVAYTTSSKIAAEKGAFPMFEAEKFLESGFMQQMPEDIRQQIAQNGMRNVTLLTQAPTGTTGTMTNTSTGIEPFFSWLYYRKSRLGLHEEQVPIVREWRDKNPGADKLPDFFVTAMDLSPEEHVRVQAAFQRWIDSSISKTSNLPHHYTVEQVGQLYEYMYDLGCKGGTIYRDGSRDEQILMLKGDERAEKEMTDIKGKKDADKPEKKDDKIEQVATPHRVYPRPVKLSGTTVSFKTPFGTSYITMNSDEHGNPFEVFIVVGKAGSDVQADAEAMGRMISLQLRTTAPHNRREMLKLIIDQLQNIGGARPVGFGPNRVLSLPDAVAQSLQMHYFNGSEQPHQLNLPLNGVPVNSIPVAQPKIEEVAPHEQHHNGIVSGADMCPECGTISLVRAEGCRKCLTCDYTEC